jgi:hypothetical protein
MADGERFGFMFTLARVASRKKLAKYGHSGKGGNPVSLPADSRFYGDDQRVLFFDGLVGRQARLA